MITAIDKRDTAIIAALDVYTAAWKANLVKRLADLKTAWGSGNKKDQQKEVKKVWKTFEDSQKKARKTYREAQKSAWKTFRKDAKTCKQPSADSQGEGADQRND